MDSARHQESLVMVEDMRCPAEVCQGCAPSTVVSTFMASSASPLGFSAKSWGAAEPFTLQSRSGQLTKG